SRSDIEDAESDRLTRRGLYPQWAHRGGPGGRVATPLHLRSSRGQPRAGFARGGVSGPGGRALSGPVRGGGHHTGALSGLYPRVDKARQRPTVGIVSLVPSSSRSDWGGVLVAKASSVPSSKRPSRL